VAVVASVAVLAIGGLAGTIVRARRSRSGAPEALGTGDQANPLVRHDIRLSPPPDEIVLDRVSTGRELLAMASNIHAYAFDHDEVAGDDVQLLAGFASEIEDCNIAGDIGQGSAVQAAADLSESLREIEEAGFLVFAGTYSQELKSDDTTSPWRVLVVNVRRDESINEERGP
jgi:hypothetical protein